MAAFGLDDLNEIFLQTFKDWSTNIINTTPPSKDAPETAFGIRTIAAQLNNDQARLVHVVDTIQERACLDPHFIDAAVAVYDLLAMFIDPNFPHASLPIKGPMLVQYHLMRRLQAQFTRMLQEDNWSEGLVRLLGRLCQEQDSIGALTPGIALQVLGGLVESPKFLVGGNFELLLDFVVVAGPFLDAQALEVVNDFGGMLQVLQKRVGDYGSVVRLAVFGLVRLREEGWRQERLSTV